MKKPVRIALIGVVLVAVVVTLALKQGRRGSAADGASPETSVALEVPAAESRLPRLLDLGSDQCIPCKKMAPILNGLAKDFEGVFQVEVIDVKHDRAAAMRHGIRGIPTQIFYDRDGVERYRHQGFMSRESILAKWRELGVEVEPPDEGA